MRSAAGKFQASHRGTETQRMHREFRVALTESEKADFDERFSSKMGLIQSVDSKITSLYVDTSINNGHPLLA